MQVLEREEHGARHGQPIDDPGERLDHSWLPTLRAGDRRRRDRDLSGSQPARDVREEPDGVTGGRTEDLEQLRVVERGEGRPDGADDRGIRRVRRSIRPAAQHREATLGVGEPGRRLVEEPADADAGRAREEQGRRPAGGSTVQDRREPPELPVPPDVARARDLRRHGGHRNAVATRRTVRGRTTVLGFTGYGAHPRRRRRPTDRGRAVPDRYPREVSTRRPPHPANELNELSGEEWLYFTKSVWTTAYPSELGHDRRKAHGANKPPRLMAKLIEFFSRTGELVLDPFAGVGGTLLGAAIARGPRRAIGLELDPRWAAVYREVVDVLCAERDGRGPELADLGPTDPGGRRTFDPGGAELRIGDARELLRALPDASVDFVATDPPYNVQLPMTMAGGRLAEAHANRRTDYAMVSDDARDLANLPDYAAFLDAMTEVLAELRRVTKVSRYAVLIVRDAYQDGRYVFTAADLAARASGVGWVPKGDVVWYQAGTRLRPYGYPRVFVPNIAHQHLVVLRHEPPRRGTRAGSR